MVVLTDNGKVALDNVVARLTERATLPGFVLGATTASGEIYFNSGGHKVLGDPTSGVIDQDAVFSVCSMTKMITHIAALQLIEQGKLRPETPVSFYFPQFLNTLILDNIASPNPTFKQAKETLRVEHLMNFSSGLFYPPGVQSAWSYSAPHSKEDPHGEFFRLFQGDLPGIPIAHEPGVNFTYGIGSDVLGFIIEKVCGISLEQYMQENIFKPLDIRASFYLTPDLKERLLPLYLNMEDGNLQPWDKQPGTRFMVRDPNKGGGGLHLSLRNYLTLLRHLLQIHDGTAEAPILTERSVKEMFTGTLNEAGRESIEGYLSAMTPPNVKGHSWSNAVAVCEVEWPGRRNKGTVFWFGWAGTHFFIDPTIGVAGVFGTQILSPVNGMYEPDVLLGLEEFEKALHAGLDT